MKIENFMLVLNENRYALILMYFIDINSIIFVSFKI